MHPSQKLTNTSDEFTQLGLSEWLFAKLQFVLHDSCAPLRDIDYPFFPDNWIVDKPVPYFLKVYAVGADRVYLFNDMFLLAEPRNE